MNITIRNKKLLVILGFDLKPRAKKTEVSMPESWWLEIIEKLDHQEMLERLCRFHNQP
jgi:hypothetical protein